jgi:outer membrane receptor for ferric coprogen and ferric-rhodotorulic acid
MTLRTKQLLLLSLTLAFGLQAQTPAPAAKATAAPASTAKIPVTNVEAKEAAAQNALQLSTFTVSEQQDLGYESMQTTSGMRTVQELKNVANSISIINAQFIEDIGATNLDEMSRWFVTGEANPDPALPNKGIFRGVVNNYAVRNGWIWYSPMESYSTERVELLRGPNAFLYGEADLGGANNQITKRGLFTRNITRLKLTVGSDDMRRAELDLNRRLNDKVALRFAAVQQNNESWVHNVRRDFRGLYGAVTYRPFTNTTISLMAEHAKSTGVNGQGLFIDGYSFSTVTTLTNTGGYIYVPATGAMFRANTMKRSNGTNLAVVDPTIVPRTFQVAGPNSTAKNYYDSITLDAEHHIGKNLHLLVSGNFYQQQLDTWGVAAARTVYRDLSPTLPSGAINPRYNQLYTEYFRTRNLNGNIVRDMRFSAVYDLKLSWMTQQLVINLQQHQDNPGQKKPKYGEYVDISNPNFVGTVNTAQTQAAFTANRTTFTSNRFMRRYYLNDGDGGNLTGDLNAIPGVSAYYPDLSNLVGAGGNMIERRFYTPSKGFGASGSYFNNHLFTLIGYRQDEFNMKSTVGAPRPIANTWINDYIPGAFAPNPSFVHYKLDGSNYGLVYRMNDTFALSYNHAQSFRISLGEGSDLFTLGSKQGVPVGEGDDMSARFTLFGGRIEANLTRYHNYQPNARISPAPAQPIKDEVSAIFPSTFNPAGTDYQTLTTNGYEFELIANLTRTWRLSFNAATNKLVTEDRLPLLKSFQAAAKQQNKATPLLDAFLLTYPDGVPNAGYTKRKFNVFTRYEIPSGFAKGLYIGGGANWRDKTFRGNGTVVQGGPVTELWSPSYYLVSLLGGYRTKLLNRPTTFSLNVDNVLNKDYYVSVLSNTGSWGAPRSYRLSTTVEF